MPEEAYLGGPSCTELMFGENDEMDPDSSDYCWNIGENARQDAIEEAYYYWRQKQ